MLLKTTCCSLFVSNELIVVNRQLRHFLAECYIAMYIWKGNVNKKADIIHVQVKEGRKMKKAEACPFVRRMIITVNSSVEKNKIK